jgi:hypothetical protein
LHEILVGLSGGTRVPPDEAVEDASVQGEYPLDAPLVAMAPVSVEEENDPVVVERSSGIRHTKDGSHDGPSFAT